MKKSSRLYTVQAVLSRHWDSRLTLLSTKQRLERNTRRGPNRRLKIGRRTACCLLPVVRLSQRGIRSGYGNGSPEIATLRSCDTHGLLLLLLLGPCRRARELRGTGCRRWGSGGVVKSWFGGGEAELWSSCGEKALDYYNTANYMYIKHTYI